VTATQRTMRCAPSLVLWFALSGTPLAGEVPSRTEQAKQAAIEGTVVLDLVVGVDGRVRDVRVVSGLGYGLDEAAITALEACRFSPGEKSGATVPVRIRGFKVRFVLPNDE
jgi:TonB family protein